MFLLIDFSCKACGHTATISADIDDIGYIKSIFGGCPRCGRSPGKQDEERIRHFADVVMTTSQRNSFGSIQRISISSELELH